MLSTPPCPFPTLREADVTVRVEECFWSRKWKPGVKAGRTISKRQGIWVAAPGAVPLVLACLSALLHKTGRNSVFQATATLVFISAVEPILMNTENIEEIAKMEEKRNGAVTHRWLICGPQVPLQTRVTDFPRDYDDNFCRRIGRRAA